MGERDCVHGSLARSCETCYLHEEIARLREERDRACKEAAWWENRWREEAQTLADLLGDVGRLRDGIEALRERMRVEAVEASGELPVETARARYAVATEAFAACMALLGEES